MNANNIRNTFVKIFNGEIPKDANFLKQYMTLSTSVTGQNRMNGDIKSYIILMLTIEEICTIAKERCDKSADYFSEFLIQLNNFYELGRVVIALYNRMDEDFIKFRLPKNVKGSEENVYHISDSFDYKWKKIMYMLNKKILNEKLVQFMDEYRNGQHSIEYVKKNITNIVRSISFEDPDFLIFKENTMEILIDNYRTYYEKYVSDYLDNNTGSDYVRNVKDIIEQNENIFEVIRNEKIVYEKMKINDNVTIKRRQVFGEVYKTFIDFFHSIFFLDKNRDVFLNVLNTSILTNSDFDIINTIYYFYAYNDLIVNFAKHIGDVFVSDVKSFIDGYDENHKEPMKIYNMIVSIYEKYFLKVLSYISDPDHKTTVESTLSIRMRELVNHRFGRNPNISIIFAEATDVMLINNGIFDKNIDSSEVDKYVNDVCIIIKFIEDKDYFMSFYKKALSKRLLTDNFNEHNEKLFLSRFKVVFGVEFIIRVQSMIDDIANSEALAEDYSTLISKETRSRIISNVNYKILKTGMWPIKNNNDANFTAHPKFVKTMEHFNSYYNQKHSGRKLAWLYDFSDAVLDFKPIEGKRAYNIACNLFQATLLMAMNDIKSKDEYPTTTKEDLLTSTNLKDEKIFDMNIQILCKSKILLTNFKALENGLIPKKTQFKVNQKAAFKQVKVSVKPKEIKTEEKKKEDQDEMEAIMMNRTFIIQGVIVKILKTSKEIYHSDLVLRTIELTNEKFKPTSLDVKKQITVLMEKDYMERLDPKKIADEKEREKEMEILKTKGGAKYAYIA